jgi:hypothetical protein
LTAKEAMGHAYFNPVKQQAAAQQNSGAAHA